MDLSVIGPPKTIILEKPLARWAARKQVSREEIAPKFALMREMFILTVHLLLPYTFQVQGQEYRVDLIDSLVWLSELSRKHRRACDAHHGSRAAVDVITSGV